MNRVERLIESYGKHIKIPWRDDVAAAQRVIFCVYQESDELRLRAGLGEFEIATKQAKHEWCLFDLTDSFPQWMATQKYAKKYFEKPDLLSPLLGKFLEYIDNALVSFLQQEEADNNTVVAISGVGSLFGFVKVKDVVDKLAPRVKGRLLVFFPGSYENNNYRLLDGYDGWNYLAVPITGDDQ